MTAVILKIIGLGDLGQSKTVKIDKDTTTNIDGAGIRRDRSSCTFTV